jgi:hypothetical protein
MALNLTKVYTQKQNAKRDVNKAVAAGECTETEFTYKAVEGGYMIVTTAEYAAANVIQLPAPAAKPAKKVPTPQVEALPGMTPLGLPVTVEVPVEGTREDEPVPAWVPTAKPVTPLHDFAEVKVEALPDAVTAILERSKAADAAAPVATPKAARKPAAPKSDALSDEHVRFLIALLDAKVWAEMGLSREARVGVWVPFKAIHDSNTPHNLPNGKLPGLTGGLRRRGLIDTGWEKQITVQLTQAGLDAAINPTG